MFRIATISRARARIRAVSRILEFMDHYLISGLFALVIALWVIVAVKRESACGPIAARPTKEEPETAKQDVDKEH